MQLTGMRNIGPEMDKKLQAIGITSGEELIKTGSYEAFLRLKTRFPNVCLVHLYVLYGAIHDLEYNMLPEDVKKDLKTFSDSFK